MNRRKLFQMIFGSDSNPHFKEFIEESRVTSPLGTSDAVLVRNGSSNYELYIVSAGKALHGRAWSIVFIHCHAGAPKVSWKDESTLLCEGTCQDVSCSQMNLRIDKKADGFVVHIGNA